MDYYNDVRENIPNEYRPMSPWENVGYNYLFAIPIVGFILAIIFSFDNSLISRRNLARSYFCGICIVLPILIIAFLVLSSGGSTTNKAQLAVFINNFSQYYDRVTMDGLYTKQTLGINSENVNNAQLYYMVANGLETASEDVEVNNRILPVGYIMPDVICNIYGLNTEEQKREVIAYVIDDYNITDYGQKVNDKDGSAGFELYGDKNGSEYHFITSNGHVFSLPGFPLECNDGTVQYFISNEKGCYYVAKGKSRLSVGSENVNGDIIVTELPIQASSMENNKYGLTYNETPVYDYHDNTTDPLKEQKSLVDYAGSKEGRYTIIKSSK